MQAAYERDQKLAAGLPAKVLFTYHSSWIYLADAFGLEIAGYAEPLPGIPPTARHLEELVQVARQRHVPLMLQEPYFSEDAGRLLARETGLRVVRAAPSCDGVEAGSYLAHIESVLRLMAAPGAPGGGK